MKQFNIQCIILLIIFSRCFVSCGQDNKNVKWINSSKLCDSIMTEDVGDNEFIFKINTLKIPATKVSSKFILHLNHQELEALTKGDSLLYLNGIEYFKAGKGNLGNLNQNWIKQGCDEEMDIFPIYQYMPDDNTFSVSEGPYELILNLKKINTDTFELYFVSAEGSISFSEISKYYDKNVDRNKKVGTITFIHDNVIEILWEGLYDKMKKKRISLVSSFENTSTLYLMGIKEN